MDKLENLLSNKALEVLLLICKDDFCGLWEIIATIWQYYDVEDRNTLKIIVLYYVYVILNDYNITVGSITSEFSAWSLSPEEAVSRIDKEWSSLGRDPNCGDICWFVHYDIYEKYRLRLIA